MKCGRHGTRVRGIIVKHTLCIFFLGIPFLLVRFFFHIKRHRRFTDRMCVQ